MDPLYQAILENPFDDLPRLVYADALGERGEHVKADWIRYSIGHGRINSTATGDAGLIAPKWPSGVGFVAVVSSLAATYGSDSVTLAPAIPGIAWEVHRGFPSKIACDSTKWLGSRCYDCSGSGLSRVPMFPELEVIKCKTCEGEGRLYSTAKLMCQAFPLIGVRFRDKQPLHYVPSKSWLWACADSADDERLEYGLPAPLFYTLRGGKSTFPTYGRGMASHAYTSAAEAAAALDVAVADYGRDHAGLSLIVDLIASRTAAVTVHYSH